LNGITSVSNFMKIYQAVQKLLAGGGGDTGRQTGDLCGEGKALPQLLVVVFPVLAHAWYCLNMVFQVQVTSLFHHTVCHRDSVYMILA
jgi:hypothetical protein